jgi:hypothetical protein
LAELYARIDRNNADMMAMPKPTRSISIDTVRRNSNLLLDHSDNSY